MRLKAKITSKGQLTIPKEIRKARLWRFHRRVFHQERCNDPLQGGHVLPHFKEVIAS